MKSLRLFPLLLALSFPATSFADSPDAVGGVPNGWFMAGSTPNLYTAGVAGGVRHDGAVSAYLTPAALAKPRTTNFGTLMQMFAPGNYRGKRIALSAYVKSDALTGWAGLWMRVDGSGSTVLALDNMQDRPIKGTTDWHLYEIVLDVPQDSRDIAFGLLLAGRGKVWISGISVAATNANPTNAASPEPTFPPNPQNLDFTK